MKSNQLVRITSLLSVAIDVTLLYKVSPPLIQTNKNCDSQTRLRLCIWTYGISHSLINVSSALQLNGMMPIAQNGFWIWLWTTLRTHCILLLQSPGFYLLGSFFQIKEASNPPRISLVPVPSITIAPRKKKWHDKIVTRGSTAHLIATKFVRWCNLL